MEDTIRDLQRKIDDLNEKVDLLLMSSNRGNRVGGTELAMEVTGYKRSTIYAMVNNGTIPVHKDQKRRKLVFKEKDLLLWMTGDLDNTHSKTGRKSKLSQQHIQ